MSGSSQLKDTCIFEIVKLDDFIQPFFLYLFSAIFHKSHAPKALTVSLRSVQAQVKEKQISADEVWFPAGRRRLKAPSAERLVSGPSCSALVLALVGEGSAFAARRRSAGHEAPI